MFKKSTSDARPHTTDDEPKPANPHHIRRDFYRLALDWIHLHSDLPQPVRGAATRKPAYRISGHPAEWASDQAALIAHLFWSWHDLVAEHRNERNPPPLNTAETVRVARAWRYLEPRIELLCDIVAAEALGEIATLHRKIQRELGATYRPEILPMPCPSIDCGKRALVREVAVGRDLIACGACNYRVREEYYPHLVRVAIDTLIDA
jgi:hypothetical protein